MRLKILELDFPYKKNDEFIKQQMENGLSVLEAGRVYFEKIWKWERRKFVLATRCMTSMIERYMKPIVTDECWKITIECMEEEQLGRQDSI